MSHTLRLGVLRLTDSAPALVAQAQNLFVQAGVSVALQVEPSWANLADKLAFGGLDAAIMLAPLALAAHAGTRGPRLRVRLPIGISRGGTSIVVRPGFAEHIKQRPAPTRFAAVHYQSTHHLLLRQWFAQSGIQGEIVVVPPDRVVQELQSGAIMGFCAGAPWGDLAASTGAGEIISGSARLRPRHLEKVLALTEAAITRDPGAADDVSAVLAASFDLPREILRMAFAGSNSCETISFSAAARLDYEEIKKLINEMVTNAMLAPDQAALISQEILWPV